MSMRDALSHVTDPAPVKGALGRLSKARRTKPAPLYTDPVAELRRLVQAHKNNTKTKVKLLLMSSDRTLRETGEVLPCTLDDTTRAALKLAAEDIDRTNRRLTAEMTRALKGVPIYEMFFKNVHGCGPITSAYYAAMVRIDRAVKVSNMVRYCGWACDMNGRLERRDAGPKYAPDGSLTGAAGTYNDELRRIGYLFLDSARKTSGKMSTSKYLDVWFNAKHGATAQGMRPGAAESKGRAKAMSVFLEDTYIVWRSIAGLPVWPSYYAVKLGYAHGGKICVNEPRLLGLDEALAVVGNVGRMPLASPRSWKMASDDSEAPADTAECVAE